MLGFLVGSAVFAILGSIIKGILRPISWATLGLAAVLFGSGQALDALNSVTAQVPSPTLSPLPPDPTATTPPNTTSPTGVPLTPTDSPTSEDAIEGWNQAVTETLLPFYNLAAQPTPTPAPAPTPAPQVTPTPLPGNIATPTPIPSPVPSPVTGLW